MPGLGEEHENLLPARTQVAKMEELPPNRRPGYVIHVDTDGMSSVDECFGELTTIMQLRIAILAISRTLFTDTISRVDVGALTELCAQGDRPYCDPCCSALSIFCLLKCRRSAHARTCGISSKTLIQTRGKPGRTGRSQGVSLL